MIKPSSESFLSSNAIPIGVSESLLAQPTPSIYDNVILSNFLILPITLTGHDQSKRLLVSFLIHHLK